MADASSSRLHTQGHAGQVLMTREQGKNGQLRELLEARGIAALELPLIEATPGPDTERLPDVLRTQAFDWVALTSPEAATVFMDGWRAAGSPSVQIAVVGKGTSRVLAAAPEAAALAPSFTPTKANAVHLSAELPLRGAGGAEAPTPTVLYPASVKAPTTLQDGLAKRGFRVTRLDTYNTLPVSAVAPETLEGALRCDVVTIASPSALEAWVALVGLEAARRAPLACIGSTSGLAAIKAGIPEAQVFWDEDPGMDGWMQSIERALDARRATVPHQH